MLINSLLRKLPALGAILTSLSLAGQEKPNIILIYTDDQGFADLGSYGAKGFATPAIDSLAANGVRFTNFYAPQAVSSASRAGLLTGCYPNRVRIAGALMPHDFKGIGSNEETLPEMLKKAGYATGGFGKWHLGSLPMFHPVHHGFDVWYGIPYSVDMLPMEYDGTPSKAGQHRFTYPPLPLYQNEVVIAETSDLQGIDTLTRWLTSKALDFIDSNAGKPFFLYFPHPMPHTPLGVSEPFRNTSEQGKYGDVLQEIDASTGILVERLRQHGLLDNTLIIFTSDNGPWLNFGDHAGSAGGLREGKGTCWEGGLRVPCVMHWPAKIPAGQVTGSIASAIDILPTLCDITGSEWPKLKTDGVSLWPLMQGDTNANPRQTFLYYYENNQLQAIRYGDWKLVYPHTYRTYLGVEPGKNGMPGPTRTATCGKELYNLIADPSESQNVIDLYPEMVVAIDSIGQMARADLGDFLTGAPGTGRRAPGYAFSYDNRINHLAIGCKVEYHSAYNNKYTGGGDSTLTDGITGYIDFSHGAWQGFLGQDFSATIVFDKKIKVSEIAMGYLENENSWIFAPDTVVISYSVDGKKFIKLSEICNSERPSSEKIRRGEFLVSCNTKMRAIKIEVTAKKVCPEGHPGAGQPAWLFLDEIIVR